MPKATGDGGGGGASDNKLNIYDNITLVTFTL